MLERAARGARLRAAGGFPAQRRPSRAIGDAGIGFDDADEVPGVLERLARELDERRTAIRVPSLSAVADRYLGVLFP